MTARAPALIALLPALALLAACSPDTGSSSAPASSAAPASAAPPASDTAPLSSLPQSSAPPSSAPASSEPASSAPASNAPASSSPAVFTHNPPGQLQAGGSGITDGTIYVPGMRFPIQTPNAFAQSQVWGHGGLNGPPGSQCDTPDYSYPWSDNFCEPRTYATVLCPAGTGHQGQDIRPNSCKAAVYQTAAAEPGTICQIGTYTVYLCSDTGRTYLYLHQQMNQLLVHVGDKVTRGQPLGRVSNNFGSSVTTIHLHFEIKEPVTYKGATVTTWVPPYPSLVDAYQRMLNGAP